MSDQSRSGVHPNVASSAKEPYINRPMFNIGDRPVSVLQMLRSVAAEGASDMFLQTGSPVRLKARGQVVTMKTPPLTRGMMSHIARCFLTEEEARALARRRTADVVYQDGGDRYRVHFSFGHTGPYATIRQIGAEITPLEDLKLPYQILKWLKALTSGVLVVCGTTDSGKTVTCTSMLEHINQERAHAILTLEDPIEHVLMPKRSMIIQKEVGLHVESFADGLRSALRENVDVIFVGEMRERDTIEQVMRAGETGHLVITTLHSDDALSAILRVVGTYAPDEQPRVRQSLAATLSGVLYQRLLPRQGPDGGRIPCVETLWANTAVRAIVRSGDLSKLGSYIGRATGGVGYRECLTDLRSFNEIDEDTVQAELKRLQTV